MIAVSLLGTFLVVACLSDVTPLIHSTYDEKRLLEIAVLLLVTAAGAATVSRRLSRAAARMPLTIRAGLSAFLLLGLISSYHAPSPQHALVEVSLLTLLLVLTLSLAGALRNDRRPQRMLVPALVISAALSIYVFMVQYWSAWWLGDFEALKNYFPGFANRRFLNQYQVWAIPLLALPISLYRKRALARWGSGAVLVLWWALLWLSDGRGAPLALGGAALVVAILFRRRALWWLSVQAGAAIAGLVVYAGLFQVFGEELAFERGLDSSGRIELWRRAIQYAVENPWLGIGPGQYALPAGLTAAHPHNAILQIAAEWGLPAAAIALAVAVYAVYHWLRHAVTHPSADVDADRLKVALTASLAGGAALSLVSGVIVMPLSQMMMAVVVGWMLAIYQREHTSSRPAAGRPFVLAQPVVMLAFCVALAASVAPDMMNPERRDQAYRQAGLGGPLKPRLWQQGIILDAGGR